MRAGGGQTAIDELEGFEEQAEAFREARRAQRRFSRAELSAELQELRAAAELAASIGVDAKARELRRALAGVLREARQRGWPDKAVVFTESRRTADYLAGMLRADGLTVTCYSGSSGGPEERQALLDEFRQRSQVLLATEAGAEGLNLQFANIVVNYDLPWNPQRIEQRIGRCHRYGQQLDVVVVNLLNTANAADRRLYELLCDKLQLFDGVFGSSDELLGGLGDGLGFERRVLDIYQSCRQPEEIERAFAALQGELEGKLEARLAQARERLLENFDGEVATRLEATEDALREELELGAELVARLLAGCAERIEPQADGSLSIAWPAALRRQRLPERVRLAEPGPPTAEWLHPGHAALESLGGWLAERCGPPHVERLRLKPGREPAVDALGADQLLLGVFRVRVEGASSEERLLYAGLVAGRPLAPELVERLLAQPLPPLKGRAVLDGACLVELARQASLQAEQLSRSLRETSAGWLAEERDKLREWVDGALKQDEDRIAALEQRLAEAREQLGALGPELEPAAPDARLRQGLLQLWEGEHRAALRQRGEDERRLRRQAEQAVAELERRLEVERRLEPVAFASVELV